MIPRDKPPALILPLAILGLGLIAFLSPSCLHLLVHWYWCDLGGQFLLPFFRHPPRKVRFLGSPAPRRIIRFIRLHSPTLEAKSTAFLEIPKKIQETKVQSVLAATQRGVPMQQTNTVVETETQLPLEWRERLSPSKLNTIPGRYNLPRMFRRHSSKQQMRENSSPATKTIATLQTSFKVTDTFHLLRTRKWSVLDVQQVVLAAFTIFSIWIVEPSAPIIKTSILLGYLLLLLMPVTRQFFLPSWPIWTYLVYFFSSR